MKLSWPKMIIASFALFMVFILVFVFLTLTDKRFDHELVTENYYGKELHLQKELQQQKKPYTLVGGRWDITVIWQYQGEPLLYKKQLFY